MTTSLKQFPVKRVPASGPDNEWIEKATGVAIEAPLTIDIEGLRVRIGYSLRALVIGRRGQLKTCSSPPFPDQSSA
jgi:hypothetical protein